MTIMLIIVAFSWSASYAAAPYYPQYNRVVNNNDTQKDSVQWVEITVEKTYYEVTEEELEMLAKIVTLESSVCSLDTQKDVCSVIFNRLDSGKWKKDMNGDGEITLYDIIYYPNAFSPVAEGKMENCTPCASAYAAVRNVIAYGPTVPTYVRYFRAGRHFTEWYDEGYVGYSDRDNVYFGYFEGWQQGQW
jgi:spore germination cell wall hydrolase CwlJ-like protein